MITRLTPTAETVACGERDGTLTVSQIATSQIQWSQFAHTGPVLALEWSPDGTWLASGGHDGMVHVFQATTGVCCASLPHGRAVKRLDWSPDSRSLCAASGRLIHLIRLTLTDEGIVS
jgi:WD40 repeat protein